MRNTSSCPQYLLPSPPTIPPYLPKTNLKTMKTHHNQYLHPHHLHHNHHRLPLQSTLLLPLLTLGHLHLIHLAHHQHHHISITNLQLHHPAQFGVISTYTTHHIAPIHHHAPHQFHLVLHLLHLQYPGMKIVFSSLTQRCQWMADASLVNIDKARRL